MIATLGDLYMEVWLRQRNAGTLTWKTKEGKVIPIKDLSDLYLANIICMLERQERKEEEEMDIMSHIGDMDPIEYYD